MISSAASDDELAVLYSSSAPWSRSRPDRLLFFKLRPQAASCRTRS